MTIKDLINRHLRDNKELADNLRPGSEDAIAEILFPKFRVQDGELVHNDTNLVWPVDRAIRTFGRQHLKVRSEGARYKARFSDNRSEWDRKSQATELRAMLKEWVNRRGYKFVHEEPLNAWLDTTSQNFLYEKNTKGSFDLVVVVNGVKTKSVAVEDAFTALSPYIDNEATNLSKMRIDARFRREALELMGITLEEYNRDIKMRERVKPVEESISAEYFAQPTKKRMPDFHVDELVGDLEKQFAYEDGLPIEREAWTLQERSSLRAKATNAIEIAEREAFGAFRNFSAMRPPTFYQGLGERHDGLDYGDPKTGVHRFNGGYKPLEKKDVHKMMIEHMHENGAMQEIQKYAEKQGLSTEQVKSLMVEAGIQEAQQANQQVA